MNAKGNRDAQRQRVVIIGGGVAGVAVAAALRSNGYPGRLVLVSDESALPYRRSLLVTAYLGGEATRKDLVIRPAEWYRDQRIDLVLGARATRIDRLTRTVEIRGHGPVRYDRLVLATGRKARTTPGLRGTHSVSSVAAVDALREAAVFASSVVVVGSGTMADQLASSLRGLGHMVALLHPDALADDQDSREPTDVVVWALGTRPDTQLARDAGLGSLHGARIDPAGRTSDAAILATGGMLGIADESAAEAHAGSLARALVGMAVIHTIEGWPRDPADATR